MKRLVAVLFVILFISSAISASAQTDRVQPLWLSKGFIWPSHDIAVVIQPTNGLNATTPVLQAMRIWTVSQSWFIGTYMQGIGTPFSFELAHRLPESGGITVYFTPTQIYGDNWGWTDVDYRTLNGYFTYVNTTIRLWFDSPNVLAVAVHEFGHALGLGHTHFGRSDLMNHDSPGQDVEVPSTLNLYALYLLSRTNGKVANMPSSPISLPMNIPYSDNPPVFTRPVPEFGVSSSWIIVVALVGASIALSRQKFDPIRKRQS